MTIWGEPRPGTEAYVVKQEAERRRKIAREAGLDTLLSGTYHKEGLRHYESWFKRDHNKKWVHPDVSQIVSGRDEVNGKQVPFVEFLMAGRRYKVTSRERLGEDTTYNDLTLYMNGHRVFEVAEEVYSDQYATTYRPFNIHAYVNDEWVSDFRELRAHHQRMLEQASIELAEDSKRLQETKEAFGIGAMPISAQVPDAPDGVSRALPQTKTPLSGNRVGIWMAIVILVILGVWWVMR